MLSSRLARAAPRCSRSLGVFPGHSSIGVTPWAPPTAVRARHYSGPAAACVIARRLSALMPAPCRRPAPAAVLSSRMLHRSMSSAAGAGVSAVKRRLALWDAEAARQRDARQAAEEARIAAGGSPTVRVEVGGVEREVPVGWLPLHVLKEPDHGDKVIARLHPADGGEPVIWDLSRPLDASHDGATLELLPFDSPEGRNVFWHSAAHVMGQALESIHGDGVLLTDGPPLADGGFFYEMWLADDRRVTEADYPSIEKAIKKFAKKRQGFQRMEVDRATAAEVFAENRFKLEMLSSIPDGEAVTLYRCGNFVDLCRGPHLPSTGLLKGVSVYKSSGSHWRGRGKPKAEADGEGAGEAASSTDGELLQRAYGIAYPSKAALDEWKTRMEEAKARDHRVIGKQQQLFMFHDMSPGSVFMLPHGTTIYNRLVDMMRAEYRRRGYEEVMTPLIYKEELWKTSGHLDNYSDDMFMVTGGMGHSHGDHEDEGCMGLKPMNCPGHCLMVGARKLSYNDLPVRIADFSSLHRNEATGALGGLTRLRRFQQDDAHVFCTHDQIQNEVYECIKFVESVYALFGFKFRLFLSTKPEKAVGSDEEWSAAEAALVRALEHVGYDYDVDEGGGAFYGPKIDVALTDAIGREHQCATIQLDFQLPNRFKLKYTGADGQDHTPVIIHRAILGSVERMMGILIEHTAGKWPFWLNPRQVVVCPVADRHAGQASALVQRLREQGVAVSLDASSKTVPKRVREHQLLQTSLIVVVGDREMEDSTVAVRYRDALAFGEAVESAAPAGVQGAFEPVADAVESGDVPRMHVMPAESFEALCLQLASVPHEAE